MDDLSKRLLEVFEYAESRGITIHSVEISEEDEKVLKDMPIELAKNYLSDKLEKMHIYRKEGFDGDDSD